MESDEVPSEVIEWVESQELCAYWEAAASPRLAIHDENRTFLGRYGPGLADSYRQIDDELTILNRITSSFRMRRNALAPVSRLPPEILMRIFSLCTHWDLHSSNGEIQKAQATKVHLTHTCRSWRHTALCCSDLWKDIHFANGGRFAELLLARTHSAPITITSHHRSMTDRQFQVVLQHLHHTKELRLVHRTGSFHAPVREFCSGLRAPAPFLETFTLDFTGSAMTMRLPDDILGTTASRLRSVSLSGVVGIPSALQGVVCLSLGSSSYQPLYPPLSHFLQMLEGMYALEELCLTWYLPHLDAVNIPVVYLRRLTQLLLEGYPDDCTLFLQSIHLQPAATLILRPECVQGGEEAELESIAALCLAVSAPFDVARSSTFSRLSVQLSAGRLYRESHRRCVAIHAWGTVGDGIPLPAKLVLELWVRNGPECDIDVAHQVGFHASLIQHLCALLPVDFDNLRHLGVDASPAWRVDHYLAFLQAAPRILTLSAKGVANMHVCSALSAPGPTDLDSPGVLFPLLETLSLDAQTTVAYDYSELPSRLLKCLRSRQISGFTVRKVYMQGFVVNSSVDQELRSVVPFLSVEGGDSNQTV